jgi:CRP/FNR family transcriptional regulator, cyclic AMP receptor protein
MLVGLALLGWEANEMSGSSSPTDRKAMLARSFLLAQLSSDELDRLLAMAGERDFAGGQVIFQKGDPGTSMMAVLEGRVRISAYSEDGKEIILNIIEPGGLFGEIALLDGKERTADATAMGRTRLLVLDRRDFIPFLERNPKIAIRLIDVLCERVRRTSELVESVAFLDFSARLARLLVRLAETYGEETGGGLRLAIRLSQQDLGNLIATTRESVNRQLNAWQQEGILRLEQGRITIKDLDALEDLSLPTD